MGAFKSINNKHVYVCKYKVYFIYILHYILTHLSRSKQAKRFLLFQRYYFYDHSFPLYYLAQINSPCLSNPLSLY